MEIKILEESKNRLVIEIIGEGHGFCNIIKKALWSVKGVEISGYNIDHPLIGVPKLIIETDGTIEPKKALEKAIKNLKKDSEEFLKSFEKQVK